MRLIMLGTGPFAVPTLQALAASEHDVVGVVTRPPRGRTKRPSPLQQAADSLGLVVQSPETVNKQEVQKNLSSLQPDLLVVCDYGEILRPETLAAARLGGVNLHGSLLPKYRGAAPIQWAVLHGETETGNSVFQMTPTLDAGPCLGQQRVAIDPEEDAERLEARLAELGAELVLHVLDELTSGKARPIEQDAAQASKAPRLKKEHGLIDWNRSAQQVKNQVRALRPWPRAYTFWRRPDGPPLRLSVDRAREVLTVEEDMTASAAGAYPMHAAPGTVLDASNGLVAVTGDGALEILELQPAGGRSMSAAEFLRGHRVQVGDRFGQE